MTSDLYTGHASGEVGARVAIGDVSDEFEAELPSVQ